MPITIVSALPKTSAPAASSSIESAGTVEGDDAALALDFASLLLGQIMPAQPGLPPGAGASDSREGDSGDTAASGETATDPLTLLAAMTQAPLEGRNDSAPSLADPAGESKVAASVSGVAADVVKATTPEARKQSVESPATVPETATTTNDPKAAKLAAPPLAAPKGEAIPDTQATKAPPASSETPAPTSAVHMAQQPAQNTNAPLAIPTSVRDPHWNDDFAQKVVWLAGSHKQVAELTLTPPNMGNIEISLHVDSNTSTATATFVSANAEVRENIETALPRLREMLAGVGIELGQANVSAESFRQQASMQGEGNGDPSRFRNDNAILSSGPQVSRADTRAVASMGRGLVDIFA